MPANRTQWLTSTCNMTTKKINNKEEAHSRSSQHCWCLAKDCSGITIRDDVEHVHAHKNNKIKNNRWLCHYSLTCSGRHWCLWEFLRIDRARRISWRRLDHSYPLRCLRHQCRQQCWTPTQRLSTQVTVVDLRYWNISECFSITLHADRLAGHPV